MPSATHLKGEFVTLRPLQREDAALTLAWRQSARAIHLNAGAGTAEQQARWIETRPDSEYNFMIELTDGRPIGMLSLIGIDPVGRKAESARFLIGDEAAAHGVPAAVEAMKLLYILAFDTLKLHRIYGTVASDNKLMIKWQLYLGMKEEGRLRDHYYLDGHFQDAICLGLLEDEYRKVSLPRMESLIKLGRPKAAVI